MAIDDRSLAPTRRPPARPSTRRPAPPRPSARRPAPPRQPAARRPAPRPARPAPPKPGCSHRRAIGLLVGVIAVLACGSLFGLAAFQAVLVSNQAELDQLATRADQEQARYQRLRLEVAQLESPDRIVAVAQERLGMVPPAGVTYLSPSGVVSGEIEAAAAADDDAAATSGGGGPGRSWATVKPYLNDAP